MTSLQGDLWEGEGVGVAASKPLAMTAWGPELRAPQDPLEKPLGGPKRNRSPGAGLLVQALER